MTGALKSERLQRGARRWPRCLDCGGVEAMDWSEDTSAGGASADRSLWLAVLGQAVEDGDVGFLKISNPRFRRVCFLADVDPEYFIRKVHAAPVAPTVVSEEARERARLRQRQYNAEHYARVRRERVSA
jgi:hypothetical protein